MIFVGAKVNFLFKTKARATKNVFECGLNGDFNMILYSDYTGIVGGASEGVCFVIPVHYPSFIFTFDPKVSLEKSVDKFFEFEDSVSRNKLREYVSKIEDRKPKKIPFLK